MDMIYEWLFRNLLVLGFIDQITCFMVLDHDGLFASCVDRLGYAGFASLFYLLSISTFAWLRSF